MTKPRWQPYVLFKSAIPSTMCEVIIKLHDQLAYTSAGVLDDGKTITSRVRNVEIQGSEIQWLNAMLIGYTRIANHMNFRYDLTDDDKERLQFSKYEKGMYFHNHMDYDGSPDTPAYTRKLSVTVQLSDPKTYEGGKLILHNCNLSSLTCPVDQGTIMIFDSRWFHRVKPVTSGVRYSLVKWVHGDTPLR